MVVCDAAVERYTGSCQACQDRLRETDALRVLYESSALDSRFDHGKFSGSESVLCIMTGLLQFVNFPNYHRCPANALILFHTLTTLC